MDSIRFSYLLILKEYWNNNFCEKWRNNHGDILVTFYPQTLVKHSELNQNALKKKILKKNHFVFNDTIGMNNEY